MCHKVRALIIMVSIILLACAALHPAKAEKTVPAQNADIDQVLKVVSEALKEAQDNNVPGFPPLKNVEINLSTVASKEADGKLKVVVVSIDGGISSEDASTITLKMAPPTTKDVGRASAIDPQKYKMALAAALNVSKDAVVRATQILPQLITSEVQIEVAFTVKKSLDGGVSIDAIGIGGLTAGIGATGKLSKSQVHKLKLVFGRGPL